MIGSYTGYKIEIEIQFESKLGKSLQGDRYLLSSYVDIEYPLYLMLHLFFPGRCLKPSYDVVHR